MNAQILIDSTVRQITVLIAQMATSGGIRAPLARVANQVFVELARELEAQGVSRKVSADMFGMALRAYIRKVRRLSEGTTETGKTLWQAIYEFIHEQGLVSRARILERFTLDGELEVSSIVRDLSESGLIFSIGTGASVAYRAANEEEKNQYFQLADNEGLEELAWVLVFRQGPISVEELGLRIHRSGEQLEDLVEKLSNSGRIARSGNQLSAEEFEIKLGASAGWEASVFDHIQAVVQTICQRLRSMGEAGSTAEVGGSTFSFDIWQGHPFEDEVRSLLVTHRKKLSELRAKTESHNKKSQRPESWEVVTAYVGQCKLTRATEEDEEQS